MSEPARELRIEDQVPWVLSHLVDDVTTAEERWTLAFEVPQGGPLGAGGGLHGVSLPKAIVNDWAAVYGYDLDTDEGLEQVVDHMLYFGYLETVLPEIGEHPTDNLSPMAFSQEAAKGRVQDKIADFKKKWEIKQKHQDVEIRTAGGPARSPDRVMKGASIWEVLKQETRQRVDKEKIADRGHAVARSRQSLQRRGMAMKDARYD
ncbi:hypothetical protein GCM10023193_20670 [Planotetraspora kaengkrachanensis]|uniref:Uncharacterized protein n=2 Tax=Planotetraspora kaengkrachanensis TaxID=575193 RepID=A0A8J3PUU0_9ACTN|nr:hypothetical protein Pka01_45670 [Planotetraspora kaengkrachanensis]